jgi:phosphoribosylaminoimidazole carboxylase PurE protein
MSRPLVGIVMGSQSDMPIMEETGRVLEEFGIEYQMVVTSAHRSPRKTRDYAQNAAKRGLEVIIAGAGGSAALAGAIASETILPVIGIPIDSSPLKGLDALYSTVQMPSGVPVATMAIGKAGAKNAAILAAQILALKYPEIRERLNAFKEKLSE